MNVPARVLIVILGCWLVGGCSATLPAYVDARESWTRSEEVWEDFESRLFVDATLKNEAFRP